MKATIHSYDTEHESYNESLLMAPTQTELLNVITRYLVLNPAVVILSITFLTPDEAKDIKQNITPSGVNPSEIDKYDSLIGELPFIDVAL